MEKNYDPKAFEKKLYQRWEEKKYFSAKVNSGKKPFTIVLPPPNITGQLHMGHALDDTIQDSIIRFKRMQGYEALWLPGVDHASIATEVKIVDKLKAEGTSKEELGREGFLKRAYEWKEQYGGRIVEQMKSLGSSCDWDRMAFTMDANCSRAVRHVFVKLYEKGLIYRGSRIINWCPDCGTALSDAEVEYEQEEGRLWHIRYPLKGGEGYITVATTRPETMLGDTAVAVNPSDKRYAGFVGKSLVLPLVGREIPVVADEYVEKDFGTGAVKITPAHDPNDYEVGIRHGLEEIRVMDDRAVMNQAAGKYEGLTRGQARERILADLECGGYLVKTEKHVHNVGKCYRCRTTVEPVASRQWFVKMEPLAAPAVKAVDEGKTAFLPARFKKVYMHWMKSIRDWCVSRQLWWGHRIPAYYCGKCGKTVVSEETPGVCDCGGNFTQDEDVLDTWFSSALWPFSTLGYPEKTEDLKYFYPTNVLVTAYDIIFFWVARMIFSGLEHMGETPFKEVLIHGIVRDEKGRKFSKSLGNGIDPLEIIDKYSADALRLSLVAGTRAGGDIKYAPEKLEGCSNFLNKLWNAARFCVMNAEGAALKSIGEVKLSLADKWILTRLSGVTKTVTRYMERYEIGLAASAVYDFVWNDFCDWYIEFAKTGLKESREETLSVLMHVLKQLLKLAHPVIPFITAEIYLSLPNTDAEDIMISEYPSPGKAYAKAAKDTEKIMELIRAVRAARAEAKIPHNKKLPLYLVPAEGCEKLVKSFSASIEKLTGAESVSFGKEPAEKCVRVLVPACLALIPSSGLSSGENERERLSKELAAAMSELSRAEGKLKNQGFVSKAPPALIEAERAKAEKYAALTEKLKKAIEEL